LNSIQAGTSHLVFPDFAVHPRHEPSARWFVEIVGFWTTEYLAAELERLHEARITNLVLCSRAKRPRAPGRCSRHQAPIAAAWLSASEVKTSFNRAPATC
jgi:predicted nuclease of restriction endonuclease-like RecB superfamily